MPNTAPTICLAEKEKKKPLHNIFLVTINSTKSQEPCDTRSGIYIKSRTHQWLSTRSGYE